MSGGKLTLALYEVCKTNGCGNHGTNHNGSCGCLLLPRPCDLLERLRIEPTCPAGYFRIAPSGHVVIAVGDQRENDGDKRNAEGG